MIQHIQSERNCLDLIMENAIFPNQLSYEFLIFCSVSKLPSVLNLEKSNLQ